MLPTLYHFHHSRVSELSRVIWRACKIKRKSSLREACRWFIVELHLQIHLFSFANAISGFNTRRLKRIRQVEWMTIALKLSKYCTGNVTKKFSVSIRPTTATVYGWHSLINNCEMPSGFWIICRIMHWNILKLLMTFFTPMQLKTKASSSPFIEDCHKNPDHVGIMNVIVGFHVSFIISRGTFRMKSWNQSCVNF